MRGYILSSIVKRDLKEAFRNPQTLIMLGVTASLNMFLGLALGKVLLEMTFSMCMVMIGFYLTSFMITEEKEKKTFEALLVSPATYHEILFGKLIFTALFTTLFTYTFAISLHAEDISIIHSLIALPVGVLSVCIFGVVVGLVCHSQAMLGGVGTMLMLVLFLPELLAPMNEYVGYFARTLPTHHVIQVARLGTEGLSETLIKHYAVLILSLVVIIYWVNSFIKDAVKQEDSKWKFSLSNKLSTFLLLLTLSLGSFLFIPMKGELIQLKNKSFVYMNKEFNLRTPFDNDKFKLKEIRFQNRFSALFQMKTSSENYIYINMKNNKMHIDTNEHLRNKLEKIEKKDPLNLNVKSLNVTDGLVLKHIQYETKDGIYYSYIFTSNNALYTIGIESKEGINDEFEFLKNYLDENLKKIQILE